MLSHGYCGWIFKLLVLIACAAGGMSIFKLAGPHQPSTTTSSEQMIDTGSSWRPEVEILYPTQFYESLDSAAKRINSYVQRRLESEHLAASDLSLLLLLHGAGLSDTQKYRMTTSIQQHWNSCRRANGFHGLQTIHVEVKNCTSEELALQPTTTIELEPSSQFKHQPILAIAHHISPIDVSPVASKSPISKKPHAIRLELAWLGKNSLPSDDDCLEVIQICERPWLMEWEYFREQSGNPDLLRIRAESSAEADQILAQQVLNSWKNRPQGFQKFTWIGSEDLSDFPLLASWIKDANVIQDRWNQDFHLKMDDGTNLAAITRTALLCDLQPSVLKPILDRMDVIHRRHQDRWLSGMGLIACSAILMTILSLLLDAWTLGYYTWTIRVCSTIATIGMGVIGAYHMGSF